MKKTLAIILLALMLALSSCGSDGVLSTSPSDTESSTVSDISVAASENELSDEESPAESSTEDESSAEDESSVENESSGEESSAAPEESNPKLVTDLFDGGYPISQIDGYLYYVDADGMLSGRVRPNGSDRIVFENQHMSYPYVFDDRIIYLDKNDHKVYSMNNDGTEAKCLCDHETSVIYCYPFTYPKDKIYLCDDESTYSIDINGSEPVIDRLYYNNGIPSEDDPYVQFDSEYRYTNGDLHDFRLYKWPRNVYTGNSKIYLTDFPTYYFVVTDDKIFYNSREEEGLFSMNTDGSDKKKICDDMPSFRFFVENNVIYYIYAKSVYRINTDGSDRQKLCDNASEIAGIEEDHVLFYYNLSLSSIRTDGTDEQDLYKRKYYKEYYLDKPKVTLVTADGLYFAVMNGLKPVATYYFEF